jgi:hypothetical protein
MKRVHPSLSLPTSIVFLLIAVWARGLGERLVRKRDNPFSYLSCNGILGK